MTTGTDRVGIEIGGTKLQLALGRGDGHLLATERRVIQPEAGAAGILAQIEEAFAALTRDRPRPEAVGIGFGGPVDTGSGVVVRSHQVEGWDGFPLADWIRSHLSVDRVAIANDADTAGLGEARFGAGVGFSPVLYLTIGSGIGGGLVIDGQIYQGAGAGAAEIGHVWIDRTDGAAPALLEEIASGWSIGRIARERLGRPDLTAPDVAHAAEAGDHACAAILNEATDAVGTAIAHAVTLIAPRRVILGGGVSLLSHIVWRDPITRRVTERVFPPFRGTYDIVTAALGETVVLHGALALVADPTTPTR